MGGLCCPECLASEIRILRIVEKRSIERVNFIEFVEDFGDGFEHDFD